MGDVDGALSVLREDLSEPYKFRALTSFLERHNRLREAFAVAEQAGKAFPDDWHLQEDPLRRYERDGWTAEAYALRRRQLESAPSVEGFHQTLSAGIAAKEDGAALREELLQEIEAREIRETRQDKPSSLSMPRGPSRTRARDVARRYYVPSGCGIRLACSCSRLQCAIRAYCGILHCIWTMLIARSR